MKSYQFAPVDLIIETSNESRSYILTTDLTSRTNYKPFCDEIEYFFAQFKKIVALSNLIQRIYHNDIRNMLP